MKKIQVLGTGCPSCRTLADHAAQAANDLGIEFELEKVTEMADILKFDVPGTPALVIDGVVKTTGRVPTVDELKEIIA